MAVTIQTVQSSSRNVVLVLSIAADNTDAVIWDGAAGDNLKLVEAQWSLTGAAATLEWDQTTDALLLECAVGNGFMCMTEGGGIPNPAGSGSTGDILLTNAVGLTSGTIWLRFVKT